VDLLVALNRGLAYPELVDAYLDVNRQGLEPAVAERFDNVLKSERMVPAAPQTVLAGLRHVLGMPDLPLNPIYPPEPGTPFRPRRRRTPRGRR
jgi:hypothetical protein